MKVIIAGSRHLKNARSLVAEVMAECPWRPTEIVEGGAEGIDNAALRWALKRGLPVKTFPAHWSLLGKAAGPIRIRNAQMAEYADALVLIWDGKSRGSASMKKEAQKRGLEIFEHVVGEAKRDE